MSVDMRQTLRSRTRRLLDIQGFDTVDAQELAPVAPWLRLAFGLCALLGGVGTLLASPTILLMLTLIATIAAASPVHPFDLIYNYGIRHLTGTGPLPRRRADACRLRYGRRIPAGHGLGVLGWTRGRRLRARRHAHVRGASRERDGYLHSLADLPVDLRLAECP